MVDCCTNPLQIHRPTNQLASMGTCVQQFIHLAVPGPGPNQYLSALNTMRCYDNVLAKIYLELVLAEIFRKN